MLIINILDILKRYSDEEHRLSQKDILEILENEYFMKADRKAVKRNLMDLLESGYDIEYSESTRIDKNGEEETIFTNWYLVRDFSDAELRLLIDGLLFSKHIPYNQCKDLIEKLKNLSNTYFNAKVKHIRNLPENLPSNKQLFLTIEVLDEAISNKRQVSFVYNEYGTDKKLHPRRNSEGEVREYIINPYQMVATNGRYYLICNNDKYDNVANYRLDRITDIRLLESPAKRMKDVTGLEKGLNLPTHMAEHIYMFAGDSFVVRFRAKCYLVGQIIDWFGRDVEFSNDSGDTVDVRVKVNEQAMIFWALQYGQHVEVLEPARLREKVKSAAFEIAEKYKA
ncbi:MAG: WYL domain-containing protein [Oscillospiraceae bacterium]|nr:WYL domain-containing protein [Oscillospiraceae bacterium]